MAWLSHNHTWPIGLGRFGKGQSWSECIATEPLIESSCYNHAGSKRT